MLFRIADRLGRLVSEIQREMSHGEFAEWIAHMKLESWEEEGLDLSGPFTPDHCDYGVWAEMRKVGGR